MARTYGGVSTDRTEVVSSATVDTAATFTWIQLINPVNATAGGQPRRKSGSGIFFSSGTNGDCFATVARATTQSRADTNTLPFPNGTPAYLILTYDAAATPALTIEKGDLNGVLTQVAASNSGVGSSTNGSGATTSDSGSALGIGGRPAGAGNPFPGKISSTAYWTRVLSASEKTAWILARLTMPNAGPGLWLEHGMTGSSDIDYSGNGNTGTVTGTVVGAHDPSPMPWGGHASLMDGGGAAPPAPTPTIEITTGPASGAKVTPNTAMTPIVVRMTTDGSTTDTAFTGNITATWKASNKYGSLGGTTVVAASAGVATFLNLVPSNVEGSVDFVITFSASGVSDIDSNAFMLWGTKLQAWRDFIDDLGGDAAVPYAYDFRLNATVVSGAYSALPDVLGDEGGRTPGDDLAQSTSGSRPAVANTIGVDASATLDGVDDYMTNGLTSALKLIGSGGSPNPLNVWIVAKATGNGTIGGIVRDETSTAQNPFMVCKPAGGDWAFDLSTDGTGVSSHQTGTAQPNFDFEYDSSRRLVGMIKRPWNTDTNVLGRFQCLIGGVPVAKHSRFPDATNANCKLVVGRHGTSYGAGEICAMIVTNQEVDNVMAEKIRVFFEGEFGTLSVRSNDPLVVMVNNSLGAGDTSSDELKGTNGAGTTTMMYYAANRNTGRGTFWSQFPLVANIHQLNFSHHGNTIPKMITDFDEDVSLCVETVRTGPVVVVMSEVLNTLNSGAAANLTELLDQVDDYYALCQAKGITFIMCTPPDARIFYTAGTINATGTIAKNFTAELRANPNGVHCDHIIDLGYVGGVFEIDKVGTKSYENATYYNDPTTDGGHLIDAGQSAAGDIIKDFFDNNPGVLYPSNLPVLLNLRRQYAA